MTFSNNKTKIINTPDTQQQFDWKNCWYPIAFARDIPGNRPYGFTLYDVPFVLLKNTDEKFICYLLPLYDEKKNTNSISVKSCPVVNKKGMIWFWTGNREEADESLIRTITNFYNLEEENE